MATIRERRLFKSGIYFVRRGYRLKKSVKSEHKHKDSVLVLLRASESGVQGHRQILSGVRVNIDGSEVVWQSQPRSRCSISRYTLEAGSTRLARKMVTYIASNMAEFSKMLERRDTSEPMHVRTCTYLLLFVYSRALIRLVAVATIQEQRLFRSALAQVQLLFESGVYSRVASIRSYTVVNVQGCLVR